MPKIYESPDKGKTVYEREFGSSTRTKVSTSKSGNKTPKTYEK